MTALRDAGLEDKVTFALLNVFGRTLRMVAGGRTHWANHHAGIIISSRVKPGVVGGLMPGSGDYQATPIQSTTGAAVPSGSADIPFTDTLGAFAKTLGAVMGLAPTDLDVAIRKGKVVSASLVT